MLVRSGLGNITLIDLDEICISNSNRQIHTLQSTIGKSKVLVLKDRLLEINPASDVKIIEDFVTTKNLDVTVKETDFVIDAIDGVKTKAYLIDHCIQKNSSCDYWSGRWKN